MAEDKSNKGNGKGPILDPRTNKPISESDRVKYKAVDDKQTKILKASNAVATKKQAAIKEADTLAKAPKKAAATPATKKPVEKKPAAKKPVAKAVAKKVAPKKGK